MTTHSRQRVSIVPDVTCLKCDETMEPVQGRYRQYKCEDCGKMVSVNGDYDVSEVPT